MSGALAQAAYDDRAHDNCNDNENCSALRREVSEEDVCGGY